MADIELAPEIGPFSESGPVSTMSQEQVTSYIKQWAQKVAKQKQIWKQTKSGISPVPLIRDEITQVSDYLRGQGHRVTPDEIGKVLKTTVNTDKTKIAVVQEARNLLRVNAPSTQPPGGMGRREFIETPEIANLRAEAYARRTSKIPVSSENALVPYEKPVAQTVNGYYADEIPNVEAMNTRAAAMGNKIKFSLGTPKAEGMIEKWARKTFGNKAWKTLGEMGLKDKVVTGAITAANIGVSGAFGVMTSLEQGQQERAPLELQRDLMAAQSPDAMMYQAMLPEMQQQNSIGHQQIMNKLLGGGPDLATGEMMIGG